MNMAYDDKQSDSLLLDQYIVPISLTGDLLLDEGKPSYTEAFGDLYVDVDRETRAIRSLSFQIVGDTGSGIGIIDLRGWQTPEQSDPTNGRLGEGDQFVLDVDAVYLDQDIVEKSEFELIGPDVLVSPRDLFSGIFSGKLMFEGETLILQDAKLDLAPAKYRDNVGRVQAIQLSVSYGVGQPNARANCAVGESLTYQKLVKLQVVGFAASEGDVQPSGSTAQTMIDNAQALWNPGFVTFDVVIPPPVVNRTLKESDPTNTTNLKALLKHRPGGGADRIAVFFVTYDFSHGGGNTTGFAINVMTALAAVVIYERACDLVLAHELGHVMGGQHSTASQSTSYWTGDMHTILSYQPFEAMNSARNCQLAACPVPGSTDTNAPKCLAPGTWSLINHPNCN